MLVAAVAVMTMVSSSSDTPKRPKILGIAGVQVASTNIPRAREFYRDVLVNTGCETCAARPMSEQVPTQRPIGLATGQEIEVVQQTAASAKCLLTEVAFLIDDEPGFKRYLKAHSIAFKEMKTADGQYISTVDPEGHAIYFLTGKLQPVLFEGYPRIIHAGWVVKDRQAMDQFYRDVLGFRLYWQGGMKDDRADWVSMQVPDGTDWIEYMLNIPPDANKHLLGVMNHIALGVPSVQKAAEELKKNGVKLTEEPKIGRDGKWQLNLYDPDDTRVELMEFTPVEKPCCSEFTGTHPKP